MLHYNHLPPVMWSILSLGFEMTVGVFVWNSGVEFVIDVFFITFSYITEGLPILFHVK